MKKAIFWFRRDLRLEDNCALFHCLSENEVVAPVFIFDKKALSNLPKQDKRVEFTFNSVKNIKEELLKVDSDLIVLHENKEEIVQLAIKYNVTSVYCNHSYDPDDIEADDFISQELKRHKIDFISYKDIAIFEKNELLDEGLKPFVNFDRYKIKWKKNLHPSYYQKYHSLELLHKMVKFKSKKFPSLEDLGFEKAGLEKTKILGNIQQPLILFEKFTEKAIENYKLIKDYPSINGTSFLSFHNRYGTISIRHLLREAIAIFRTATGLKKESCEAWINQIILRDFYFQILYHHPHVIHQPFNERYNDIILENNMYHYQSWCEGKTGYPIIDAAMQQLNTTGYLHHKMKILVSSFLTKILLIDYRFGEDYFANKLLDYDLAANNSGWQWAASCGCDAYPASRIINPIIQSQKLDKDAKYIKKFIPILNKLPSEYLHQPWSFEEEILCYGIKLGKDYPYPIVNFKTAKEKALVLFSALELEYQG